MLILLCNLVAFLLGSRWRPQARAGLNALAALMAALLLIVEFAPAAARNTLLVVVPIAAVVAFYRLSSSLARPAPRA